MAERPDVLFVLSDQHNAKFLGCKATAPFEVHGVNGCASALRG